MKHWSGGWKSNVDAPDHLWFDELGSPRDPKIYQPPSAQQLHNGIGVLSIIKWSWNSIVIMNLT